MKKPNKTTVFYVTIRSITLLLLATSIVKIVFASDPAFLSEYIFITINALALFVLSLVPYALKKLRIQVPYFLLNIYLVFITCGFLMGEILGFYKFVPWWDDMLHFASGGLITLVGFSIFYLLNQKNPGFKLSPMFVVMFSFFFAMTSGVVWELFEFAVDWLSGSNMQRFRDSLTDVPFVGQQALLDTMNDFFLNTMGSIIMSILGYFDLKYEKNFFNCMRVQKTVKHPILVTASTNNASHSEHLTTDTTNETNK